MKSPHPQSPGRGGSRGRTAAILLGVSMALWVGLPSTLLGQEAPDEPAMPEAPTQFRVGLTLIDFDWAEEPGLNVVEDASSYGLEVESVVHRFLSFRFGVSFGQPEIRSGVDRASADQYMVEILANARLPVGPLGRHGVTPFISGGYGSVVHAPEDRDDLITKNQSAYLLGAGVEYDAFSWAGFRMEWRRARVEFNDVFSPQDRSGTMREMDRWVFGAYWRF